MSLQNAESLWMPLHWLIVHGQQGSYTAAAARLGVSKAAMSQRIAELERAAGVPLVRRTTRSMRLTEAGQQLVDQTREPFEQIAHSFLKAQDHAGEPRGLVRVTAPVALGRQQLLPRLADFLLAHPAIRIGVELADRLSSAASPSICSPYSPRPLAYESSFSHSRRARVTSPISTSAETSQNEQIVNVPSSPESPSSVLSVR